VCVCVCVRILNKFLDDHQEDILPWHESIEPCLTSISAFINEREVRKTAVTTFTEDVIYWTL